MKNKFRKITKFSFQRVMFVDVRKTIKDLTLDKCSSGNISDDIIKQRDLCFQTITDCINKSIVNGKFPDSLKSTNNSPAYKTKDPYDQSIDL